MDKHEVAHVLEEIALFLEIRGEKNSFKIRAYHNAARALEALDEDLVTVVKEKRLEEIPGIGEKIAKKIAKLVLKGSLPYYAKLKSQIPEFLIEMMDVPGLGAKKVKYLYDKLKISSVEELKAACEEGKVAELAGFGKKTEKNILQNIARLEIYGRRALWWEAGKLAFSIAEKLAGLKEVIDVDIAGSFRRKVETVGDIDFIVASEKPEKVMEWFTKQSSVELIQAKGKTRSSVRLKGGIQAEIRIVKEEQFAYALLYYTGSKEFNILLRQRANKLGYTLNEYTLQSLKGNEKIDCATEEEIFQALKLNYIPPELREGLEEFKVAEKGKLPKLVVPEDIKGIFHCHTTDSDGHNTVEEMARAAEELGWEYLGISDHSKSSYQANGMYEERLFEQNKWIDALNQSKKFKVHIFKGLECDVLQDGSLDFPDEVLSKLDYVIVSMHQRFKLDEKAMTARLIRAIENPYTTIIGHMTGRLLLRREPMPLNLPKVIDACIANHKIVELNGYPTRLDMDWRYWHKASEKGLLCCINPDAHRTSELLYYQAGVNSARKGWLTKKNIINTLPLSKIKKLFQY